MKQELFNNYLSDETVTDIFFNSFNHCVIEKKGTMTLVDSPFETLEQFDLWIERTLYEIGQELTYDSPFVNGELSYNTRIHMTGPPITTTPLISLRKNKTIQLDFNHFLPDPDQLIPPLLQNKNILISGGTGSGKSSFLQLFIHEIPKEERLILLEETPELNTHHPHLIKMHTKDDQYQPQNSITLERLVRECLRMRPDRILIGECRGPEAFAFIQALNTGHAGSLCTLHANSGREALHRLALLCVTSQPQIRFEQFLEWVSQTIHYVIHLKDHHQDRGIDHIERIVSFDGGQIQTHSYYKSP